MSSEHRPENPLPVHSAAGRAALLPELRAGVLGGRLLLASLILGAGGLAAQEAYKALTGRTSIVNAANLCTVEDNRTVINFINADGKPNEFEPGIDIR